MHVLHKYVYMQLDEFVFCWSYGFVVDNSELDNQYRAHLDKKLVLLLEVISHLWFFV